MSAPKKRPAITGETTIAELAAILRDHHITYVEARADGRGYWSMNLDGAGRSDRSSTIHGAFHDALHDLRVKHADELDLTTEEAAS